MGKGNKMKQVLAKKTLVSLLSLVMTIGNVYAADNSIYIDQAGDNSTISITQDGAGNIVRGIQGVGTNNQTPARLYGTGTVVTIDQIGSGNTLSLGIQTTTGGTTTLPGGSTATAPTVIYSVTGNSATAVINSNNTGTSLVNDSNYISVTQTGNTANTNINVEGNNNAVVAVTAGGAGNSFVSTVVGDNNLQNIGMTGGGGNTATIKQGNAGDATTNTGGVVNLVSVGATNTFAVTQTGGGANGHNTSIDLNGSGNTVGVTQAGTIGDNIANIKVGSSGAGSNGSTITINQNNR